MFHEGHPKWEFFPDTPDEVGGIGGQIMSMDSEAASMFIDSKWNKAVIMAIYKDRNVEKIKQRIAKAQTFIDTHPSDNIRFRLAGGLLGVVAATHPEIEKSYWFSLAVAFSIAFLVFLIFYRSILTSIILLIPIMMAQALLWIFMCYQNIDISVNILAVPTVGVGIATMFGIYIMSRISEEYKKNCNTWAGQ